MSVPDLRGAPALTFPGLLRERARTNRDRPFVDDGASRLTYAEADDASDRLARGLVNAGLRPDENVVLLIGNRVEFIVAWFAVLKAGAVIAPMNTELLGDGLQYNIEACEPALVIAEAHLLARVPALPAAVRAAFVLDHDGLDADGRVHPLATLTHADPETALPEPDPGAACQVMFTSGTTGRPKGVRRFTDVELRKAALAQPCGLTEHDVLYCPVPLFHGLGLNWVQMAMWAGASVAIVDRFTVSGFRDDIVRLHATAMPHVGTMVSALMSAAAQPGDADLPLRISFGIGVPVALWLAFEERFGLHVVEFYGSTETGLVMFNPPGGAPGAVGKIVPGVEVRLVDPEGSVVPVGLPGELHIQRTTTHGMPAYLTGETPAEAAGPGGWFRTGDLLRETEDGTYFYVGRSKSTIRRRGENIVPEDIERVVDSHPGVVESCAVAVPSETR